LDIFYGQAALASSMDIQHIDMDIEDGNEAWTHNIGKQNGHSKWTMKQHRQAA
jgi:hypothetical protein